MSGKTYQRLRHNFATKPEDTQCVSSGFAIHRMLDRKQSETFITTSISEVLHLKHSDFTKHIAIVIRACHVSKSCRVEDNNNSSYTYKRKVTSQ